ncbi:hypothetical protein [Clostridium tyrobutyricum]|uniref:hypothetical protein n=1 Tax=Clostridium tyrobutyricum TaxID=1519 RepID=UPI001C384352|nr:hypothetical protein [Clostridium tyrobutyricum]MBV4423704.1 hypothetical protein [Clostridium tyrobutyricum]
MSDIKGIPKSIKVFINYCKRNRTNKIITGEDLFEQFKQHCEIMDLDYPPMTVGVFSIYCIKCGMHLFNVRYKFIN